MAAWRCARTCWSWDTATHGYGSRLIDVLRGRFVRERVIDGDDGPFDLGGLALDDSMNLFLTDRRAHVIRKFHLFGAEVLRIGGRSSAVRRRLDRKQVMQHPNAVSVGPDGRVYVAMGDRPLVHGVLVYDASGALPRAPACVRESTRRRSERQRVSVFTAIRCTSPTRAMAASRCSPRAGLSCGPSVSRPKPRNDRDPVDVLPLPGGTFLVAQVGESSAIKEFDTTGTTPACLGPMQDLPQARCTIRVRSRSMPRVV